MKLMYITNNPVIAKIAENTGVDWIFIDLEINGKEKRQGHLDTVISRHSIDDVSLIRKVLTKSELLVRVNPLHDNSRQEIEKVITDGADIVMLPFFKTVKEVEKFVNIVNGKAKTCLLLETPEAVDCIEEIVNISNIDYIHIGLNDLHLGYKKKFMFELLVDGTVEKIISIISKTKIVYGFGGIARVGLGDLPAEMILKEHKRLSSELVILSRSFCDLRKYTDIDDIREVFASGVSSIRKEIINNEALSLKELEENRKEIFEKVKIIVERSGKNV